MSVKVETALPLHSEAPEAARPPAPLREPSYLAQLLDLYLIQLSNWRWSWRSALVIGTLAPLLSILGLGLFARDAGPEALGYVLTGNVVLALMFGNLDKLQSHFSYLRATGALSYYATLPIHRSALILATVLAFLTLSLPSLLATVAFGALLLGVPLHPSPLLLLAIPLTALPLAGIGALIGATARTPQDAGSLSLLVTLIMLGLGPVIAPRDRLPALLIALGRLSPATYAAEAWRQVLLGPITGTLALDLAVLAAFAAAAFGLVAIKMDWRESLA